MTRILIVSSSLELTGGVSNYIDILIKKLDKDQFEIRHFSTGRVKSFYKNLFYPFLIIIQIMGLKKVLRDFEPEVIHMNPSLNYFAIIRDFILLKMIKHEGYPVLLFIHGWQESISDKFRFTAFKKFFKKRFDMADKIVVLANQFKVILLDLGISSDKIFVSSTMADSTDYLSDGKKNSESIKILFCAVMKKEKGPYEVLESANIVLKKYPNTKFVLIGKGKDLEKLIKKSKEMKIERNVEFTGYVSYKKKVETFKDSHIFVFPTVHGEGFPTVILEAMAAGLPVVTTATAGLLDAIEDGREGFIIKSVPPDPIEISEMIIRLIEDSELMKKISGNNLKRAKEEFDAKVISAQIGELYNNILM